MPTQNVNLTDTLDVFVKAQVLSGHFNNASEVHRSAWAAMARQEEERQLRMKQLRREIQTGIDDVNAGRSTKITSTKSLSLMLDGSLKKAIQKLERVNAEPFYRTTENGNLAMVTRILDRDAEYINVDHIVH